MQPRTTLAGVLDETGTETAFQIAWIARQTTRYAADATVTKTAFLTVSTAGQMTHSAVP
jgi:hypothetical protein